MSSFNVLTLTCSVLRPHHPLTHPTTTTLDASTLSSANRQTILEQARGLFYDSDIWPAQRSRYYLGILPTILKVNPTSPDKTTTTQIDPDSIRFYWKRVK